jgi:hypothetical protein
VLLFKQKDLDEATVLSAEEATALSNCGSFTAAKSRGQLNMILGCSMARICFDELDAFANCWTTNGGDTSKCVTEGRALMTAFRPYMEKIWIKDKRLLQRGATEITFIQDGIENKV